MTPKRISARKRHERWVRLEAGLTERCDPRLPDERDKTYIERQRAMLRQAGYSSSTIANWSDPDRGVPDKEVGRLATLMGWTQEYMDDGRPPKNQADAKISGNRDLSTAEDVGMPGKEGHTTTVNLTTNEVKQGSILPLLPWNRVELMLLPNDRSEISELPDAPRVPLVIDWDPGMAKVIEMPNSSLGRPAKGDYLIFDPSLTADRTHIPDQLVLARTPGGAHLIRRYDAADMESKQQAVVCWCEQWYPPKNT